MDNWPVLSRLKRAVNKARLLLKFRWGHPTLVVVAASGKNGQRQRLGFNNRPSLMGCLDSSRSGSDSSGSRGELQRVMTCLSSWLEVDDIDRRADAFISNFHRQLR
ncbi:hypothetical protein BT93_C1478 [Corymbia citriodora subsp. variegata]|uniref:Uncharacterized protein n=1 Tax=Corymbia citriodora subsp. variegata TaxID=360336 RepID=A0A8T0CPX0_CORYI|nr:hypothetical protein BT93_L2455 [Corymbia citriodora subsp. variegata]KAF8035463.1 hypothetical protein BT93_C1478 [Corymbia citriodora subsp. variegata]